MFEFIRYAVGMQDFIFTPKDDTWLKNRGYLHLTKKWNTQIKRREIYSKVQDSSFVQKHAFFPLLHAIIKERKYKKHPQTQERGHVHKLTDEFSVKHKQTAKNRPLHYATHIDALIFSFYAAWLIDLYEKKLKENWELSQSIIAYRRIPQSEKILKGKSTIHFANEAFKEIKKRSVNGCAVLMFDIESFFSSLDHTRLKGAWAKLLNRPMPSGEIWKTLPADHYNVFKACTQFNYILKDDLRLKRIKHGRRAGFDEEKLASIRKQYGIEAFFANPAQLRAAINTKRIRVFSKQFVDKDTGKQVGIPQGLPISAILANLYLLDFDLSIITTLVNERNCYYRRYSDDILIICKPEEKEEINKIVQEKISQVNLKISKHKTETFEFQQSKSLKGKPLTYLGFEYNGLEIFVKSANLARFYRRMIYAVKRKAERAVKISVASGTKPIIFKSRLVKLYKRVDLDSERDKPFKIKRLVKEDNGNYVYRRPEAEPKNAERNKMEDNKTKKSNYISYMRRATNTIDSEKIFGQIKKRKVIFHEAMSKHVKRLVNKYKNI
ncbi:reverse transcriptase domain-containing protein [Pedobacter sp. KBW06]|uniref:reverse transcriptase domain-containing protein n=1 Tax=Pedobacter sp. KBW06 TaxID=2153359 RepID=UPI001315370C|nr:reverse transcriptase domain-containing protein [Pedobacter sp. KBW06]